VIRSRVHAVCEHECGNRRASSRLHGSAATESGRRQRTTGNATYASRHSWPVYASLLQFAETIRRDVRDSRPRDMIDLQSFVWVQGSDEYAD
jgi:hypothetical protein